GGAGRGRGGGRPALGADLRRAPGGGATGGRRAAAGRVACRGGRRLHVGRVRGGDLRGGGPALPRAARLDGGAGPPGSAPRVLGAAERATGRAAATALARGPARLPRAPRLTRLR